MVTSVRVLYWYTKEVATETFVIEEVEILLAFVLVGRGYVQHKGSEWHGKHCTGYHSSSVLENHALLHAIAFGNDGCTAWSSK